ncbi:MAG: protein-L-isoaspartate O-methyltransferase [Planctomycetaceae bacterium]|nr:protein-L-isoaspartate O-methyltransferase [Planctomycetaceae bacterium]
MTSHTIRFISVSALLFPPAVAFSQTTAQLRSARHRMVEEVVIGAGVKDRRVLQSIRDTPRHEFVGSNFRKQAYFDMALPIGFQQTISSPFIVAYMTESLDTQPTDKVLEIGTGSGYQAAVLSPLVKDVYTIEIVEELGQKAARTLKRLKYNNVHAKVGDGFKGWPEHAPFNKIIVTCSPEAPPQPLIDQLADGGLMVIPAGRRYQQTLYLMRKKDGKLEAEALRPTLFVPMTGRAEDLRRVKPDATKPQAVNGDFEEELPENGFVPGWYYQRQLEWVAAEDAPQGEHYVKFANQEEGRTAHLLQGIPIDGRAVKEVEVSAFVKYSDLFYSLQGESFPSIVITFYDANRKDLGHNWIGPFRGKSDWKKVSKKFRVPPQACEGLVRIGLFGVTGEISLDAVQLKPLSLARD